MASIILDTDLEQRLIADRRARGADRFDEVWEGMHVMSPTADNEHQDLCAGLTTVLRIVVQWRQLGTVFQGVNVSDRKQDWQSNFRCPDVAVYLNDTQAENCETFWYGGPDLAIEIVSPYDRSREKLEFYGRAGTRELLLIDRDPWKMELYELAGKSLHLAGCSSTDDTHMLCSQVVPLTWRLATGNPRPQIEIISEDGQEHWLV